MKYMLAIHLSFDSLAKVDGEWGDRVMAAHEALQKETRESGEFVEAHELLPDASKVVRTRDGELLVTDGPFTESKEWIAGYYIVDCVSAERAAELAGRLVEAELSPIEIRMVH